MREDPLWSLCLKVDESILLGKQRRVLGVGSTHCLLLSLLFFKPLPTAARHTRRDNDEACSQEQGIDQISRADETHCKDCDASEEDVAFIDLRILAELVNEVA